MELVALLMARYGRWPTRSIAGNGRRRRGAFPSDRDEDRGHGNAWRTMLELRSSEGAELEIRRCAVMLLRLLRTEAPGFFSDFEIYVADDRREAARIGYHKV